MIVETGDLRPIARAVRPGWTKPLVAAVAALTVAMGGVLGAYLISGRAGSGTGALAAWAPADAALYAEVDASLPGSQRANLESLLSRWPAVDSDAILGDAFGEWVDRMLGGDSVPFSYRDDVAPWLSGQAAIVMPTWPQLPAAMDPTALMTVPEMAAIIGSRDDAAARAFVDRMRQLAVDDGATFTSTTADGTTIWSIDLAPGTGAVKNGELAYAVADGAVVVGTGSDTVGSLLATRRGSSSLATDSEVGRLVAALPSPRIGLAVVDAAPLAAMVRQQFGDAYGDLTSQMSGHVVESLSLDADRIVTTAASLASDASAVRLSEPLAERIPADALVYGTVPHAGTTIGVSIDAMFSSFGSDPSMKQMADEWRAHVESAIGFPLKDLFNWAGDGAAYVTWGPATPAGGLVLLTDDPDAARAQLGQLTDALVAFARDNGTQVIRDTHDAGGTTVTTISMVGAAPGEAASLAYAVTDAAAIITVGDGAAPDRFLATDAASSLAGSSRFTTAVAAVGGGGTAPTIWVDLAGIVSAVAAQIPADARSDFDTFIAPNLAPLDHVVSGSHVEGGVLVQQLELVLR